MQHTRGNKVQDRQTRIFPLERVFNHDGANLALRGKVLNLAILDGAQQSAFPAAVSGTDSVASPANEAKGGVGQEEECTIRQGEKCVAKQVLDTFCLDRRPCSLRRNKSDSNARGEKTIESSTLSRSQNLTLIFSAISSASAFGGDDSNHGVR